MGNDWFSTTMIQVLSKQRVFIKGTSSDGRPLKYDVPQCSILGAKLF